jgi:hypothetical protein
VRAILPRNVNGVSRTCPPPSTTITPASSVCKSNFASAPRISSLSGRFTSTVTLPTVASSMIAGSSLNPGPEAFCGGGVGAGAGVPMLQLLAPDAFCSTSIAMSCKSSFLILIGPDTSDQRPISTEALPTEIIGVGAPHSALASVTPSTTSDGFGRILGLNSPAIRNSRPVARDTAASTLGRKRLKSPNVRYSNAAMKTATTNPTTARIRRFMARPSLVCLSAVSRTDGQHC